MTTYDHRWQARPVLAAVLRCVLLAVPLLASSATVFAASRALPADTTRTWWGLGLLLVVGLAVAVILERGARRLLPIALLLKLSMIFPDRAPSRLRLARAAAVRQPRNELLWTGHDVRPVSSTDLVLDLVSVLGRHDRRTRGHSERVRLLCDMLAVELKLDDEDRDRLRWAALLHDIGKVEVSTRILNKPGQLTPAEFDRIKLHPAAGAALAAPLLSWLGSWGHGILDHHERYDGLGYPNGTAGEDISQAGRLIGLVDAFETMTSARPYKKALATRAAREELARCAGTHFDPVYVRAFLAISLPRLLWAIGPLSFVLQLPFLQPLVQSGARLGVAAPQTAGAVAAGAAGAVLATGTMTGGAPSGEAPERPPLASSQLGTSVPAPAVLDVSSLFQVPRSGTPRPTAATAQPPASPQPAPPAAPTTADRPVPGSAPSAAPTTAAVETDRAIVSGPPSTTTSRQATFTLAEQPGVTWECQLIGNGDGSSSRWQPCSGTFTVQLVRDGDHALRVRDAATKKDADSWEWTVSR